MSLHQQQAVTEIVLLTLSIFHVDRHSSHLAVSSTFYLIIVHNFLSSTARSSNIYLYFFQSNVPPADNVVFLHLRYSVSQRTAKWIISLLAGSFSDSGLKQKVVVKQEEPRESSVVLPEYLLAWQANAVNDKELPLLERTNSGQSRTASVQLVKAS